MFLPLAPAFQNMDEAEQFRTLLRHYSVPSAAIVERLRNVKISFGTCKSIQNRSEGAWLHFTARTISFGRDLKISWETKLPHQYRKTDLRKLWLMCDFYLDVKPAVSGNCGQEVVTLLCFGAPDTVYCRFEKLLDRPAWSDVLSEPYLLFDILFDELLGGIDQTSWRLWRVANPEEIMALNRADVIGKHGSSTNYQNLHNIQK